jgi:Amt family ammonium transporter
LRARAAAVLTTQMMAIVAAVTLITVVVGYTVAFGAVTNGWLGSGNAWMLIDLANLRGDAAVPEIALVLVQLGCAGLAALLLSGGWAERGATAWAVPAAALWALLVQAPLTHWLVGGGWLQTRLGAIDTGGALTIHGCAGVSALVITLLIGPRAAAPRDAHAPGQALAGNWMMLCALLALAAAGTLGAGDDAASALVNGLAASAAGALVWVMIDAIATGQVAPLSLARGALSGLIAASAAMAWYAPGGAIVAGLAGALVTRVIARWLNRAGIDDALGVIAVHGGAGLAGAMLAAPLIAGTLGGSGYAAAMGPVRQVIAQAVACAVVVTFCAIGTAIAALMVAMVVPMRIPETEEVGSQD